MPPRSSTNEPRRRRGGRRGGASAASSRHRQASVKSFFTKAASPKPEPPSPSAYYPSPLKFIPAMTPGSPSIPDEEPDIGSLDSDQPKDPEKPRERIDPPSQDIPEEAVEIAQLDEPSAFESEKELAEDGPKVLAKGAVKALPEDFPKEPTNGAASEPAEPIMHRVVVIDTDTDAEDDVAVPPAVDAMEIDDNDDADSPRRQVVSLPCQVNIAPSRDRQIVSPFLCVSLAPNNKMSVASPVTPGNSRFNATEKLPLVPCTGLSEDESEQPSRLSRRRNLARRAAAKGVHYDNLADVDNPIVVDDDPIVVDDDKEEEPIVRRSRKRSCPKSPQEKEKKVLHPFFKATAASVKEAKDRPKRPRVFRPQCDAWAYPAATVHVNCGAPLLPWTLLPALKLFADAPKFDLKPASAGYPIFKYYSSETRANTEMEVGNHNAVVRRKVSEVDISSSDMWAEKYKRDERVDVISATATKELVDWLTPWYTDNKEDGRANDDSSDDDSMCSFMCEPEPSDRERIAIVSGAVGCGKSTIIANAARQLGLTILEINASTCRTGKRIRDIIREALRTHRVASKKPVAKGRRKGKFKSRQSENEISRSGSSGAKTLILFEEVDELQEDEKGFWPSLQELAASDDCRRPIICTVNSFSHQMQQLFVIPKDSAQSDFERLMIGSREDHLLNPVAFKDISFPERSERQATAVLKRVMTSEKVQISSGAIEYLARTYRKDTRRAINLLHLVGLPGLHYLNGLKNSSYVVKGGKAANIGVLAQNMEFNVLTSISEADLNLVTFHLGSESYKGNRLLNLERFSVGKEEAEQNLEALEAWCTSLSAMSSSDTILCSALKEMRKRCAGDLDDLCLDADLQTSTSTAEQLGSHAVAYSSQYMCFDDDAYSLVNIAKDMQSTNPVSDTAVVRDCPLSRRPISAEYVSILRTMAREESERASTTRGADGVVRERAVRRTRASVRKSGFAALDLNVSTVCELKRTAFRPQP